MQKLIDKITEAIEMINDTSEAFYNRDTGEIAWLYEFMDPAEKEKTAVK